MCPSTEAACRPLTAGDFSLVFPPDPGWVRTARDAVRTAVRTAGRGGLADTALLLTSEVVTNAVNACRSGGCSEPVTLYGEWPGPGMLRVLVHDGAPGLPERRWCGHGATGGRGLYLVGACADDWGVCRHGPGGGKSVWFELGE
ncbi:magnesium or manganese-dependent protein phosphatase [Streptomyces chrestomyceticus JCM 4735]|uniref:Magnesium or manganese-dependent protein phosphatase n=1 Tax=Streptomyces chrestomyceticus JCM 4735 TaxID=1306181 RepID=A0A7U9KW26_9ACTN|nr:ATP-binding protein [Streptomyces chrestomyceticus]GCD35837.1 magnesium or manganese-dependent protein phosphatase [Streptomyces chrestomyceticus JCM 4735]